MFERGKIILVPFPFTDLSAQKIRPALIISNPKYTKDDVIVLFISSQTKGKTKFPFIPLLSKHKKFSQMGLKTDSVIRCDKIATLDKKIVLGELGELSKPLLLTVSQSIKKVIGV